MPLISPGPTPPPRDRAASGPGAPEAPRLRVTLRSVDHRVVDAIAARLSGVAERGGATVEGPIPLPSQPSAIEGLRTHVRQLDLVSPPPDLLAALRSFDLPSGVEIELAS